MANLFKRQNSLANCVKEAETRNKCSRIASDPKQVKVFPRRPQKRFVGGGANTPKGNGSEAHDNNNGERLFSSSARGLVTGRSLAEVLQTISRLSGKCS
ncbi:hypothetical protein Ddc_11507 [Ditylenchus destructor]|nr:hypothetical protein Ddc_11507 [Ditylenchus destructor]